MDKNKNNVEVRMAILITIERVGSGWLVCVRDQSTGKSRKVVFTIKGDLLHFITAHFSIITKKMNKNFGTMIREVDDGPDKS